MALFTKVELSGSTDGMAILVDDAATPGKQIHAAHVTALDEVWLYASNSATTAVKLTIEYGQTTSPIEVTIPGESGLVLVIPGLILTNSKSLAAFAGNATDVSVVGYVNRIE